MLLAAPAVAQATGVVSINGANPPTATAGQPFSFQFEASGGNGGPYQYAPAAEAGTIPPGLTLSSTGLLSGTPVEQANVPVNSQFWITACDQGCEDSSVRTEFLIVVIPPGWNYASLQITTTSLPSATVNKPYSVQLQATGGVPPYTWTEDNRGGLPPEGINLAPDGTLSGIAKTAEKSTFLVRVTDSGGAAVSGLSQWQFAEPGQFDEETFTLTVSSGIAQLDPVLQALVPIENGLSTVESDLAVLPHDLQIAVPTTETCITNILAALATSLGQGGTPQPGQPLC
jgi:hypothetical protein